VHKPAVAEAEDTVAVGGGHMGGFAGGHIGGFGGAHVAGMGRDRFVGGRRGFYGYGADCPYCGSPYTWPYTCTY